MKNKHIFEKLEEKLGKGKVEREVALAKYTTMKAGGPAQFLFVAGGRDELVKAFLAADELKLKFTVLGGGSNVFIQDRGVGGLVVINRYIEKETVESDKGFSLVKVSSGYPVTRLVKELVDKGLGGLEYHFGLPGTIGGAVYMNSKWTNPTCYIGDPLLRAEILEKGGGIKEVDKSYFNFAYDYSILQDTGELVLTVAFRLEKTDKSKLKKRAEKASAYRRETQPYGLATSGCFFKNVDGQSAGELIDKAGLKGCSVGSFYVSKKHANFIVNKGRGDPEDLKKLLDIVKKKVKKRFGIDLEEEVIVI